MVSIPSHQMMPMAFVFFNAVYHTYPISLLLMSFCLNNEC